MDDQDIMDDEIEESLFELSFHRDETIETSYHHIQENLQQVTVSLIDENEINQEFDVDIHVFPPEIAGDLQLVCQFSRDQDTNSEVVHVGNILYEQEDCVQEIVYCHKNNNDNLQTELSNETTTKLFDQQ